MYEGHVREDGCGGPGGPNGGGAQAEGGHQAALHGLEGDDIQHRHARFPDRGDQEGWKLKQGLQDNLNKGTGKQNTIFDCPSWIILLWLHRLPCKI